MLYVFSLFNTFILFNNFFTTLGIPFLFPALFLFGIFSTHTSYNLSNMSSIISIPLLFLHIVRHGISFMILTIFFQSIFRLSWKFNDRITFSVS